MIKEIDDWLQSQQILIIMLLNSFTHLFTQSLIYPVNKPYEAPSMCSALFRVLRDRNEDETKVFVLMEPM